MRKLSLFFAMAGCCFAQFEAEKWIRPDAAPLAPDKVRALLEHICPGHANQSGCDTCPEGSTGAGTGVKGGWSLRAVTRGHFLTPSSEDAVISGAGCEPHVADWGGSFLLSKHLSVWRKVWYVAGMKAWDCKKLVGRDGRDRLVCGATHAANGGSVSYYLFLLDLGPPLTEAEASGDHTGDRAVVFFATRDNTAEGELTMVSGAIERVEFSNLAPPRQVRIIVSARLGQAEIPHQVAEKTRPGLGPELQIATLPRRFEFIFDGERIRPGRNNPPMDGVAAIAPITSYSVGR